MEVNALVHAIYMLMVGVCCASLAIWMFVDSRFKDQQYIHKDFSKGFIAFVLGFFAFFMTTSHTLFYIFNPYVFLLPVIYVPCMLLGMVLIWYLDKTFAGGTFLVWVKFLSHSVKEQLLPTAVRTA